MNGRKDLKSQPKTGRYFPIFFGDAVRLLKESDLTQSDGSRLAIRMENIEEEFDKGHRLVDIRLGENVAIYSLPEEITGKTAKNAVTKALNELNELTKTQKIITNSDGSKYSHFCAYLNPAFKIVITRKDISTQQGKYQGNSKFSNAFKSKKTTCIETTLSTTGLEP
ncbi:hypothetical protein MO867_18585 [Microbulbifer sp. OS29]|uniref:Uncharacterized protein n=1 Tax=Microbulbifer okhotskensis TaxID=2926617 RepID=A0A9X2J6J4_9GAMM|nr:hypothetical protein [Microbulbifer okhotskensis]MCO1336343.1 hypothetical protein [Microbulbifer okhotskensis]